MFMIAELGHFTLILALGIAVLQTVVPLVGAHNRWSGWMRFAEPAATAQFVLVSFSFAALTYAFVCPILIASCFPQFPQRQADAL